MNSSTDQIPSGALSISVCSGYGLWQDHLAAQCKRLIQETKAKYIRLDEMGLALEPCANPAHGHASVWNGCNSLELLRKVRQAVDQVDPNVMLFTEGAGELFNQYADGALVLWSSGPDIAPLKVVLPSYQGFSYHTGEVEAAISGFVSAFNDARNDDIAWYNSYHDSLWGTGLEKRPACYPSIWSGDQLQWHVLSDTFYDAVRVGQVCLNKPHMVVADQESYCAQLWESSNYWLLVAGSRAGVAPDFPIKVELPELPDWASYAFEFDVKTKQMKEIELVRMPTVTYVFIKNGLSAVFFPKPDCPPLLLINDDASLPELRPGQNITLTLKSFAPWNQSLTNVNVNLNGHALNLSSTFITTPASVTLSVPGGTESGFYFIKASGDTLPLRRWLKINN